MSTGLRCLGTFEHFSKTQTHPTSLLTLLMFIAGAYSCFLDNVDVETVL